MIEHVSFPVKNIKKAKKFYAAALKPLGYKQKYDWGTAAGYMAEGHTSFIIAQTKKMVPSHIAFRARGKKAVNDFHKAALKAGGKDHGKPGYRDYSPGYYAAFAYDSDGNNLEAVWFDPKKA